MDQNKKSSGSREKVVSVPGGGKTQRRQLGVPGLVIALVVVLFGGVMFVGAVSGWFGDGEVKLDEEYYCGTECQRNFIELSEADYEKLLEEKKSFVVFVDQGGCTTADRMRGYVADYAQEKGIRAHRIMFDRAKESSLHEVVKYYPSVVVVSKGKVVGYLRADSDEDAPIYNDYETFRECMGKYFK